MNLISTLYKLAERDDIKLSNVVLALSGELEQTAEEEKLLCRISRCDFLVTNLLTVKIYAKQRGQSYEISSFTKTTFLRRSSSAPG